MSEPSRLLAVISDMSQYNILSQRYGCLSSIKVLCDNPVLYKTLTDKKVDFTPIEDADIKEKWQEMTYWGCEKSLFQDSIVKDCNILGNINIKNAFYPWFSYYLAAIAKYFSLARFIFDKYKPEEVIIFTGLTNLNFPRWSGNYFLNLFMGIIAKENGIKSVFINIGHSRVKRARCSLRDMVRAILGKLYGLLFSPRDGNVDVMVHGSLKHLSVVMESLKEQRKDILFYDIDFRPENLRFCSRLKIKYAIPESFISSRNIAAARYEIIYKNELDTFLQELEKSRWFTFEGKNLGGTIRIEIQKAADKYIADMSLNSDIYSKIIERHKVKKLLLNEDITVANSYMASFFRSRGCKIFCISHGFPLLYQHIPTFSLAGSDKRFQVSETLAQSEFEKELYMAWGWDGRHVYVTGMPRYDRLAHLRTDLHTISPAGGKMRLLYCASGMFEDVRVLSSYPGAHYNGTNYHARECLKKIIKAMSGMDIELIIKPHYNTDEVLWESYIDQCKNGMDIKVVSASTDFLDILSRCHAMVVGYSSTAVIESALLGIPTIMIYYNDPNYICELVKKRLCVGVRNAEELKMVLNKIYNCFIKSESYSHLPEDNKDLLYSVGINDGQNTKRVLDFIFKE